MWRCREERSSVISLPASRDLSSLWRTAKTSSEQHELAHAGICATRWLMAAQVVWRGMSSDMAAWCRDCQFCARRKASPKHTAPVQAIPIHERRFTHVDLVGPLPASADGFKYLFTMVDRSSMASEDCVDALISAWVTRFGVPSILTSDQGRQFTSSHSPMA
jgi:hypothetical protein